MVNLRYISPSETARMANVSVSTVYRLIEVGILVVSRPTPRKVLILEASVNEWLRNSTDPDFWDAKKRKAMLNAINRHKKKD